MRRKKNKSNKPYDYPISRAAIKEAYKQTKQDISPALKRGLEAYRLSILAEKAKKEEQTPNETYEFKPENFMCDNKEKEIKEINTTDRTEPTFTEKENEIDESVLHDSTASEERKEEVRRMLNEIYCEETDCLSSMSLAENFEKLIEEYPNKMAMCVDELDFIIDRTELEDTPIDDCFAVLEVYYKTMDEHPDWEGCTDGIIGWTQEQIADAEQRAFNDVLEELSPKKYEAYRQLKEYIDRVRTDEPRVTLANTGDQIEYSKYDVTNEIETILLLGEFLKRKERILIFEFFGKTTTRAFSLTFTGENVAKLPPDFTEQAFDRFIGRDPGRQYMFY